MGQGAFGEVYLAKLVRADLDVAVKIETPANRAGTNIAQALTEARFLRWLAGTRGIPRIVWAGTFNPPEQPGGMATDVVEGGRKASIVNDDRTHAFAMELLGPDLNELVQHRTPDGRISAKTAYMLAD